MKFWQRKTYCCTNLAAGCAHALSDARFSQRDFDLGLGRCGGTTEGCGDSLQPAGSVDVRPHWAAAALVFAGAVLAWVIVLRPLLFPAPLAGISFAVAQTRMQEPFGILTVELLRQSTGRERVQVRIEALDGDARSGRDYVMSTDSVWFEVGEQRKSFAVNLLPDPTRLLPERHFTLRLNNVAGQPAHVVLMQPKHVELLGRAKIEREVKVASARAADIAAAVVKLEQLKDLVEASRFDKQRYAEFRLQEDVQRGNLSQLRRAYEDHLRGLQEHPPTEVLLAMAKISEDLRRNGDAPLQASAIPVLRKQFEELLRTKSFDIDRWVIELGAIIPRLPNGERSSI